MHNFIDNSISKKNLRRSYLARFFCSLKSLPLVVRVGDVVKICTASVWTENVIHGYLPVDARSAVVPSRPSAKSRTAGMTPHCVLIAVPVSTRHRG